MRRTTRHSFVAVTTALLLARLAALHAGDEHGRRLPPPQCNLRVAAPVADWYEALPLGNGQLGVLIWGNDNQLVVKLQRLDVWDERCNPVFRTPEFSWKALKSSIEEHRGWLSRFRDSTREEPPLPVMIGKLLLTLPEDVRAKAFVLDLARAEAAVDFQDGRKATAIASAAEPVILVTLPCKPEKLKLWAPGKDQRWMHQFHYPEPVVGEDETARWYEQTIPATDSTYVTYGYDGARAIPSWKLAVYVQSQTVGDNTLIAMTVTTSQKDGPDPLAVARARTGRALAMGYARSLAAHQSCWARFWATSSVNIPDATVLQHYYLTRYYLGASSSPGCPAMAQLYSLWPAPVMLPGWKNNLHNDLETQVQYQSYQTAGNFAEGRIFLDYLWERLPTFRGYARAFYGTGGAAVPGTMSLGGNPTFYSPQWSFSPTYAGWFGWLFYQHWRYTRDEEFLKTRAYPWCAEIAKHWSGLLKPDENGMLKLPLSTTAETHSFMTPNSNQDIDLMRIHLLGLAEMADALGKNAEAARWRDVADKLGPLYVDKDNVLMWNKDHRVTGSHRHFSQVMGIWPFNLMTIEGSDRDRQIIRATMTQFARMGYGGWFGFSWPWMSSICSRVGDAESAYRDLDVFVRAYTYRNGFDTNMDMCGTVLPKQKGHYFTIEANILANQAVHDMLIQSWAPSIGKGEAGIVRLFPATPWNWHAASFEDLRAEGGFRVSARRANNATVWFKITADAGGLLRLRDNFGGRWPQWVDAAMPKVGQNFEKQMRKGETVEATLATPAALPVKPTDAYTPITATLRGNRQEPAVPGWKTVSVTPQLPAKLESMKVRFPTVAGPIVAEYEKAKGYRLIVPEGVDVKTAPSEAVHFMVTHAKS